MPGTEIISRGSYAPSSGGSGGAPSDRQDTDLHYANQQDRAPFANQPPPERSNRPRRPVNLRPLLISGDRDYIIYVECRADGVVIYPARQLVPLSALQNDATGNPLLLTLQQMIDRRQASVRPGDLPYRPQVRFLVRPEHERTYHLAYPTLDRLPAAKTRQTLEPEDDVLSIISGY